MSSTDLDAALAEADEVIVRLRTREPNPGQAGRWLLRIADRLDDRPEVQARLRAAAGKLVEAEEELQQVRESLRQQ